MPNETTPLGEALAQAGYEVEVEVRGALAIMRSGHAGFSPTAAQRAHIVAIARGLGCSHVALEL